MIFTPREESLPDSWNEEAKLLSVQLKIAETALSYYAQGRRVSPFFVEKGEVAATGLTYIEALRHQKTLKTLMKDAQPAR